MFMSIRFHEGPGEEILGGQKRDHTEIIALFNKSNFESSLQSHINDDCCLVFVDLYHPQTFEVATNLK